MPTLDELKKQGSIKVISRPVTPTGKPMQPIDIGFFNRLKSSFGSPEEQERMRIVEEEAGLRGFGKGGLPELGRDIAQVAGSALPIAGMIAGAPIGIAPGATAGFAVGGPPGAVAGGFAGGATTAGIGAGIGEAVRQQIGKAIGVQQGITPQEQIKGIGEEAIVGAAAEVGGRFIKPAFTWLIAKPAKHIASILGGYPKEMLEMAFQKPEIVAASIKEAARNEGFAMQLVLKAKSALTKMQIKMGQKYKAAKQAVYEQYKGVEFDLQAMNSAIIKTLDDFGIWKDGKLVLDKFSDTNQRSVRKMIQVVRNWKDFSIEGLNNLRARIDDSITHESTEQLAALFTGLKSDVTTTLYKQAPELAQMNLEYSAAKTLYGEILKGLNLGDKASIQTSINKLIGIFNKKGNYYQELVSKLSKEGGEDLYDDIIALTLKDWLPQGTLRKLGAGLSITSGAAARAGLGVITTAGMASPRIVAKIATTAGKISKKFAEPVSKYVMPVVKGFFRHLIKKTQ